MKIVIDSVGTRAQASVLDIILHNSKCPTCLKKLFPSSVPTLLYERSVQEYCTDLKNVLTAIEKIKIFLLVEVYY